MVVVVVAVHKISTVDVCGDQSTLMTTLYRLLYTTDAVKSVERVVLRHVRH